MYDSLNTPIEVGIASFGMSGSVFHAPLLSTHPDFYLSTIIERHREDSSTKYPTCHILRSFEEMIHKDSIDLVVVNTPDRTHFDYVKMALEAGKHVIVEKPFTITAQEAEKLTALAKTTGKMLSVFQNRRWDNDFLTVRRILDRKLLGRLVSYEVNYDRFRPEITPNTWKENATDSEGLLYGLGSHLIDQAMVLFGDPSWVFADLRVLRSGGEVDDSIEIHLGYDDLKVILRSSYLVASPGPHFALHGTAGSFIKYGMDPQEEALKEGGLPNEEGWGVEDDNLSGTLHTRIDGLQISGRVTSVPGNYLGFYDNISSVLQQKGTLAVTADQVTRVMQVMEACQRSSRDRCIVKSPTQP